MRHEVALLKGSRLFSTSNYQQVKTAESFGRPPIMTERGNKRGNKEILSPGAKHLRRILNSACRIKFGAGQGN